MSRLNPGQKIQIGLRIDIHTHKLLSNVALKRRHSLAEEAAIAVEEYLDRHKRRNPELFKAKSGN